MVIPYRSDSIKRLVALVLEQEHTANQARPTVDVTTDSHVFEVVPKKGAVLLDYEVSRFWQIKARFQATGGDAIATVILWAYDVDAGKWFHTAVMTIKGTADAETGGILSFEAPLGSTHAAFEISGLGDGDEIRLSLRQAN